jgi:hypothetical protein
MGTVGFTYDYTPVFMKAGDVIEVEVSRLGCLIVPPMLTSPAIS